MITIQVLGLDQYVIGHYSKDNTANLANLYETSEDDINFYAPYESLLFHNGVEQTSWNTVVFVKAPHRYGIFEKKVAEYLLRTLSDFTVHLEINFEYIEEGSSYSHISSDYPRFLTSQNIVRVNEDEDECASEEHDEEADPRDRADLDYDNPDEIYLGNAFAGHEEELEEMANEKKGRD